MDEQERRLRRAAVTKATQQPPEPAPPPPGAPGAAGAAEPADPDDPDDSTAQRLEQQTLWVDLQVRKAMARGDFDDLPGAGKPLKLPDTHDPDWWLKGLIEREKLTGVAPPAIGLRREDAELDAALDREPNEQAVRGAVEDFNRRVVEARRQLQGGPPVVTATRDVELEVARWQERRRERAARLRAQAEPARPRARRTSWWRRR